MSTLKPVDQKGMVRRTSRSEFFGSGELYRPEWTYTARNKVQNEKIWKLMSQYQAVDMLSIQTSIVKHVEYTLAKNRFNFDSKHCYKAVAHSIRDRLIESFNDTQQHFYRQDIKRVYYLSLEFLLGRQMQNLLINLNLENNYRDALLDLGFQLEALFEEEYDPALGNGGLGRLAACFLDSMATLDFPAWGYGLRYEYGIFKQKIMKGWQVEVPDYWLQNGNPWEIERTDVHYPVRFYGKVTKKTVNGKEKSSWVEGDVVVAQGYDNPFCGYNTFNSINLRLWKSLPINEFDFSSFNSGDYFKAIEERQRAEYITSVLYPNDSSMNGKELRLKQQYFFVCATLQDVLRRFKKSGNKDWKDLPKKMSIQLNDTHPALAIIELLRILIDIEDLEALQAYDIVHGVFSYTNHTVLPEALETWSVELIGTLLPRHLEIIYLFNFLWLERVSKKFPGNSNKLSALSIVQEGTPKKIRMAHLSIVGSHTVNGVAELHSELLKTQLFKDFYEMLPKKFQNKTNGVTPRRWIRCANPALAKIYSKHLGDEEWLMDIDKIRSLKGKINNKEFIQEFQQMKLENKKRLVRWVQTECGIQINENSLFDVMVKRIHEYKRQLMNAFYVIHRYLKIKSTPIAERKTLVPRVILVGGKAAPAYINAKRIIKLFNCISETVNIDPDVGDLLKVVFLPNYNVTNAQIIIPAAELSQHISMAGMEASGTSNMKFAMNGSLIIGTLDGANVEIAQEIGNENMFIFGAEVDDIQKLKEKMVKAAPSDYFSKDLLKVFEAIDQGVFGREPELVALLDTVRKNNDTYLVGHDFKSYCRAQEKVDELYKLPEEWTKKSIKSALFSTKFSSDRTINQYAEEIWKVKPCSVPQPATKEMERVVSKVNMSSI